jgi:hypothetical protein
MQLTLTKSPLLPTFKEKALSENFYAARNLPQMAPRNAESQKWLSFGRISALFIFSAK